MKITIIEPYFTGSHKNWILSIQKHTRHDINVLSLPGRWWKWRMQAGAIELAKSFQNQGTLPDLILTTDMLDLPTFLAITRKQSHSIPVALYFHENQITYPWSDTDRDIQAGKFRTYGMINIKSAITADICLFNSEYHLESFLAALEPFLNHFPDYKLKDFIPKIRDKSKVLHLGLELSKVKSEKSKTPVILWNHRWEYDKNPKDFFAALDYVDKLGLDFNLSLLGENFSQSPVEFELAKKKYGDKVLHYGFLKSIKEYEEAVSQAHILPVTSNQDFFGISTAEAVFAGLHPLLPKRLAFPEIYKVDKNPEIFYDNQNQLQEKLAFLLQNPDALQEYSHLISPFDWQKKIIEYDNLFEDLKST